MRTLLACIMIALLSSCTIIIERPECVQPQYQVVPIVSVFEYGSTCSGVTALVIEGFSVYQLTQNGYLKVDEVSELQQRSSHIHVVRDFVQRMDSITIIGLGPNGSGRYSVVLRKDPQLSVGEYYGYLHILANRFHTFLYDGYVVAKRGVTKWTVSAIPLPPVIVSVHYPDMTEMILFFNQTGVHRLSGELAVTARTQGGITITSESMDLVYEIPCNEVLNEPFIFPDLRGLGQYNGPFTIRKKTWRSMAGQYTTGVITYAYLFNLPAYNSILLSYDEISDELKRQLIALTGDARRADMLILYTPKWERNLTNPSMHYCNLDGFFFLSRL